MRSRRRRPFYRTSIVALCILAFALAQIIGYEALKLSNAIARSDLLTEWMDAGIILGCVVAIFLLVWAMLVLSKNKYRKSSGK
jgi:ABC-type antimicrobial peptide transport system permease subunit